MAISWVQTINVIFDGEFVKSKVINRPLNQFIQRTDYLYEMIQNMAAGQLLIAPNVGLEASLVPGASVYYNETNDRFEAALAEVEEGQNNYGYPTERAKLRGVVLTKHTDNTGDIGLAGRVPQSVYMIDWSAVSDTGVALTGDVNVSAVTAGNMSKNQSHLTVRIGSLDGAGNLYVDPDLSGDLRQHLHYKFQLTENLGASIGDQGWLTEAVFTANGISVPSGYTHGYNVATDADLVNRFPPVPLVANSLFVDGALAEEVEDYLVDDNGIWWKGADTPWTKPTFFYTVELATDTTTVTSLNPHTEGIPVTPVNAAGEAAQTGDIKLKVNVADMYGSDIISGLYALSTEADDNGRAKRTTIINRLFPGVNVSLEGTQGSDEAGYFGSVTVNAGVSASVQLAPVLAELNNTQETKYDDIPVVNFPQGRSNTQVVYKVAVPSNIKAARKLKLQLDLLSAAAVNDNLNIEYQVITPGSAVPTSWTSAASVGMGITAASTPNTVETEEIDCEPGDTVMVRITQPAASPSYDLSISRSWAVIGG